MGHNCVIVGDEVKKWGLSDQIAMDDQSGFKYERQVGKTGGNRMKLSLVVPCYNEQEALPIFYRETKKVMESMDCDYEMIFVNDGSKDGTLELLKEFAKEDTHVTYIGFSRNFGKEAAMYAGFCNVTGDYAAVMDADMQEKRRR